MVQVRPDGTECGVCRHYFVTHEAERPHGCRHFGFVSRHLPSAEVVSASGEPCRAFDHRAPAPPRETPRPRGGWLS